MSKKQGAGENILVFLEPEGKELSMRRPKMVWQLLKMLDLEEETALVARDGKLLTPDRHIWPGDHILVRIVASRG